MFLDQRCPSCERRSRLVCDRCLASFGESGLVALPGFTSFVSLFDYDDRVGRVVLSAKNGGRRDVLRQMGRILRAASDHFHPEVVTWVPASPSNRVSRGYDQGRLLARSVAARGDAPIRRTLARRGGSQKGRCRSERLAGAEFHAVGSCPSSVLIVDDVVTTGASLSAAATVLRTAGAESIVGLTIASSGWPAHGRE